MRRHQLPPEAFALAFAQNQGLPPPFSGQTPVAVRLEKTPDSHVPVSRGATVMVQVFAETKSEEPRGASTGSQIWIPSTV